ncbi:DUF6873 family GME fold protein [Caproicibacter fermentans]|uniref:DUF6873 domain-containing protein n=1 Tax=Caproicibacter fermentans TaxID=2576756 RepID=A0A7G8TC81_9FIRM|nr:hypothetical protein [Caproicibacter fermentans]QNK41222.1 hypothetical protein HCR03_02640 [Caproicibacter fermentans]
MRFLKIPNLPESDVVLAAVSHTYPGILSGLTGLGVKVIPVQPAKFLEPPVQSHADLLCQPLGANRIIAAKGEESLKLALENYGFRIAESAFMIESPYPKDCALNAARIGKFLIANKKIIDPNLLYYLNKENIKFVDVRQGYAKCSVAIADEKSIITADCGIQAAALKAGFSVLKIQPGFIKLAGFPYGFLGGACGLIGKRKIAFAGNPVYHPDYQKIKEFLDCRKIEIISLYDGPLLDVGGIIPLMER